MMATQYVQNSEDSLCHINPSVRVQKNAPKSTRIRTLMYELACMHVTIRPPSVRVCILYPAIPVCSALPYTFFSLRFIDSFMNG